MKIYKRLLKFIYPFKKQIFATLVFTILFSILNGLTVYLTIPLLDTLFLSDQINKTKEVKVEQKDSLSFLPDFVTDLKEDIAEEFNNFIFSGEITDILFNISLLIILSFLLKNIFGYLQAYFITYVQQRLIKDIRDTCYVHLHKLPMNYFKNEKTGDLISRMMNDVNLLQSSITQVFIDFIREPITIIVFIIIAVSISWQLFLFSIVILPVSAVIIGLISNFVRKQSLILQQKMGNITSILQETILGIKIVKAFGMENYEIKKFKNETNSFFRTVLKKIRIRIISSPSTEFIAVIVGVIIIYYGGMLVLVEKSMRASEFMGFLFAIFQMIPPMKKMANANNNLQESIAAGERIFELLDTEPSIKNIANSQHITDFKENLIFNNISFHYENSEELVLNDISVKVNKGEIIALVGSSGAGKTTFVDLIPRFYDPTAGYISIDGVDIKNYAIEDLRQLMGIVTQETVLFNETIANNIAYGLENFPKEKIIEVAKIANAHEFITNMPQGYNTIIGEQGTKLSGGQRQRISIARALLKNPPIMIFDEATSALDNESEMLVQGAIEKLMKKRTTFVIAHRLSTIRNADRILVLDKGKIIQQGKHDELLQDTEGVYSKLYELQFRNLAN